MNTPKVNKIVSYDKLPEEVRRLFNEAHPDSEGHFQAYYQKMEKADGTPIFYVPFETEDTRYRVKFDVKIDTNYSEDEVDNAGEFKEPVEGDISLESMMNGEDGKDSNFVTDIRIGDCSIEDNQKSKDAFLDFQRELDEELGDSDDDEESKDRPDDIDLDDDEDDDEPSDDILRDLESQLLNEDDILSGKDLGGEVKKSTRGRKPKAAKGDEKPAAKTRKTTKAKTEKTTKSKTEKAPRKPKK